jgi:hypothetical protein
MKTALSIIGIVFLVLLLVLGGLIGFGIYAGNRLDVSSKAYVDESVPAIVTHWSQDELSRRESPQFRRTTSDSELTVLFNRFAQLGGLRSYDGSRGDANLNFMPGTGLQITAAYIAQATFQNGKAELRVNLIQIDGNWRILGFRIESPMFAK